MDASTKTILILAVAIVFTYAHSSRHTADIISRPDDVIGASCGEEVRMTCVARTVEMNTGINQKSAKSPDIEWWFRDNVNTVPSQARQLRLDDDPHGRVKILVEEFYVVRSVLVINWARPSDEGVYQCRASSSPERNNPRVNRYQHWTIEEAPVKRLNCPQEETSENSEVQLTTTVQQTTTTNSDIFHHETDGNFNNRTTSHDDVIPAMAIENRPLSEQAKPSTTTATIVTIVNNTKSARRLSRQEKSVRDMSPRDSLPRQAFALDILHMRSQTPEGTTSNSASSSAWKHKRSLTATAWWCWCIVAGIASTLRHN